MSIPKITQHGNIISALLFIGAMGTIGFSQNVKKSRAINDYGNKIMNIDSTRYLRTAKSANKSLNNVYVQYDIWKQSYEEMQDSLNKAGIANKSYIKGLQNIK